MIAAFKKKILETTWDDLNVWAGTRSVARGKGYVSRVEEIEELPSGELIAHVQGSDRYLTKIGLDGVGEFKGECSCPVGRRCKHTVALILKAAKELREGRPIEKCSDMDSIRLPWTKYPHVSEGDHPRTIDFRKPMSCQCAPRRLDSSYLADM